MFKILFLFLAFLLGPRISAQVILQEDFSNTIPPAGWLNVNVNNNSATYGWRPESQGQPTHDGWAWHDKEYSIQGDADNMLVSPPMDFAGVSSISMEIRAEVRYSHYMAHHPNSLGDGTSTVELTLDGVNWVILWSDTSVTDGVYTECVDLPPGWGNQSGVRLGIRYTGMDAHRWFVDSIRVEATHCGGPSAPDYSISSLVAGANAWLSLTNVTPNGSVIIGYSLAGPGPTMTPYGLVDMSLPILQLPPLIAYSNGTVSYVQAIPLTAAGLTIYTQAVDLSSGLLSNSIAEVVQ